MSAETIEVEGHFSPKTMTKVEFAKRWTDHIKELRHLGFDTEWQKEVDRITAKVGAQAEREFDRLL